jgi:hypothetical protein
MERLFTGAAQGGKRLANPLPILSGYKRKLQAVLATLPPTNRGYKPHDRGSIAQPKFQFKSLSRLQFRTNHCPETAATQIDDAGWDKTASIFHGANDQMHVLIESRHSPPVARTLRRNPGCLPTFSRPAHDKLLEPRTNRSDSFWMNVATGTILQSYLKDKYQS